MLRTNWAGVERLAGWLRSIGALTPPHGIELERMAREEPPRVLTPDVETFFRLRKQGKGKLEALRLARKQVRAEGFDHPFFWAPFVLVGEVQSEN